MSIAPGALSGHHQPTSASPPFPSFLPPSLLLSLSPDFSCQSISEDISHKEIH